MLSYPVPERLPKIDCRMVIALILDFSDFCLFRTTGNYHEVDELGKAYRWQRNIILRTTDTYCGILPPPDHIIQNTCFASALCLGALGGARTMEALALSVVFSARELVAVASRCGRDGGCGSLLAAPRLTCTLFVIRAVRVTWPFCSWSSRRRAGPRSVARPRENHAARRRAVR